MPTYAIGDIHGCLGALEKMLSVVGPAKTDTLILLGDYVNRGTDSRGVIDRVIELRRETNLVTLRGNHDYMMMAAREHPKNERGWLSMGGEPTVRSYPGESLDNVPSEHWRFLEECVDWHETDTHIFVHATADPSKAMNKQKRDDLHWNRLSPSAQGHRSGKTIVCGHTAQRSGEPLNLGHTVCIDTGCVYGLWLTCLEVETGKYWQTKEEGWSREGALA